MKIFVLVLVSFFPLLSSAVDWFNDDVVRLCKEMVYKQKCQVCTDGWSLINFKDKDEKQSIFGSYSRTTCVSAKRKTCGDSFEILNQEMTCEEFLKKLRAKQKDCKGCLAIDLHMGG